MMTVSYSLIAQVTVSHDYYLNGVFRDLKIRPEKATREVMRNYGVFLQSTEQGFSIYSYQEAPGKSVKYLINKVTTCLVFDLYSENSWYINFTEVPLNQLTYQCFSNKNLTSNQNELSPEIVPEEIMSGKIASVWIHLDELLKGNGFNAGKYSISFAARRCQWHYLLVCREQDQSRGLMIQDLDGEEFEGPEFIENIKGQITFQFSSGKRRYALKERPGFYCTLLKKSGGAYQTLMRLPAAFPGSVTSSDSGMPDKSIAISSIYIYL